MKKTRDEVTKIYQTIYPNLKDYYSILHSEIFLLPPDDEAVEKLKKHSVAHIPFVSNISDCNHHAWFLWAGIQREYAEAALSLPKEERITRSYGWLTGMRKGIFGETPHTMATVLTDKRIIIIETQTDLIEEPNTEKFDAYLLVM